MTDKVIEEFVEDATTLYAKYHQELPFFIGIICERSGVTEFGIADAENPIHVAMLTALKDIIGPVLKAPETRNAVLNARRKAIAKYEEEQN